MNAEATKGKKTDEPTGGALRSEPKAPSRLQAFGVTRIGAVYVLIGIIVVFSLWRPEVFPTITTLKSVLNENAVIAIVSLSLIIPLCTGVFDLSIGNVMAVCSVMLAWMIVEQGVSLPVAIAAALVVALIVGMVNAFIIVVIGIDSFIATLGTGALLQAVTLLISKGQAIASTELNTSLGNVATTNLGGIQITVFVALVIAAAIWWMLEHTVTGRRLYATGFNEEATRLAGVPTRRLRFGSLLASALIAGIAGILLTAQVGSGSPDIGPAYLLTAFATAFLGATQIKSGRFNAVGTIIGVLLIGTGTAGLTLVGAQPWALSMFTGLVLIVSLVLTRLERKQVRAGRHA